MHEESPLIEAAHVKLSGISESAFELPAKGEERIYTVRARRDGYAVREFKTQPDRVEVTMKVIELVEGEQKLAPRGDEPSLFDGPAAVDDDEPAGPAYDGGPSFSAGA